MRNVNLFTLLGIDTSLSTMSDVLKSTKHLRAEAERLEKGIVKSNAVVNVEKAKLKSVIAKIQKQLHIGNLTSIC